MSALIVGHRGVGKSALLERARAYFKSAGLAFHGVDLDRWIEDAEGISVAEYFASRGERAFRAREIEALSEIVRSYQSDGELWVAAGAGFEGSAPEGWRVIWASRASDSLGRVFVDRPRLNPELSQLDEFLQRKPKRDERYAALATEHLVLDEGFETPSPEERDWVLGRLANVGGFVTADAGDVRDFRAYLLRLSALGPERVELRDDLHSSLEFEIASQTIPSSQLLLSARDSTRAPETVALARRLSCALDWALELGSPPAGLAPEIVSVHVAKTDENLEALLARLDAATAAAGARVAKASPVVLSFAELARGEEWCRASVGARSFLPRSQDGRWAWYRLLAKGTQPIQFWRESSDGSAPDQPPLLRWARARRPGRSGFAAVLGDPVAHSRTPAEQREFCESRALDCLAVRVTESDWDAGALGALRSMGLVCAAVTAPLKGRALAACDNADTTAQAMGSANSLAWSRARGEWVGANTDSEGFRAAWAEACVSLASSSSVALWGGGGTSAVVRAMIPGVREFSARTGQERAPSPNATDVSPQAVVWAVGRSRMKQGAGWPPAHWAPSIVCDLNYAEDSPGREYALRSGARYFSGLSMFREQARLQRAFWAGVLD